MKKNFLINNFVLTYCVKQDLQHLIDMINNDIDYIEINCDVPNDLDELNAYLENIRFLVGSCKCIDDDDKGLCLDEEI